MAKIISVDLLSVPEVIDVSDNINDITVVTELQFHKQDIDLEMDYCLHLFVYDIHGEVDAPLVLPNWDESSVISVSLDRKDDFLGQTSVIIRADKSEVIIKTAMALHLGKLSKSSSYIARKLEVFATVAPVVGRASKWSKQFSIQVLN